MPVTFSNQRLMRLIVPFFLEQFLVLLVGLADTMIISYTGEAAVSGVSLVNSFNIIFIYLFTALASGGAVVISQFIGRQDDRQAGKSASQLLLASTLLSLVCFLVVFLGHKPIMRLIFGRVEADVMQACVTYVKISALSYPFLAIYNVGAAIYRSIGRTSVTMLLSLISNVINIAGNLIGVFVLKAGVAGVAWPTFLSRCFSGVVITLLCFRQKQTVRYSPAFIFYWDRTLLHQILRIAVPNGIESGMFQLTRVVLSSFVALFGTMQIAANGVAQSINSLASLSSTVMGPVFITVIGQCMGAGDTDAAEKYFKKLLKLTVLISVCWNTLIYLCLPLILRFNTLADETKQLVTLLVLIHNIFNAVVFPFAGPLGNGLRAAGDAKFTMYISIATTVGVRVFFAVLLGLWLGLGVIGVAIGMCIDWTVRGIIFILRLRSGIWKTFHVI